MEFSILYVEIHVSAEWNWFESFLREDTIENDRESFHNFCCLPKKHIKNNYKYMYFNLV